MAVTGHGKTLTPVQPREKFGLCRAEWPLYPVPMDTIVIKDLGVLCRIGVPDEERAQPQRLLITVEMGGDFSRAGASDDIQHTINYFDVSRRAIALCQAQPYRLLEKLAEDIARVVLTEFGAQQAAVEIKKFILSEARYVSVRMTRSK
jgi:FolB domain-containing protein